MKGTAALLLALALPPGPAVEAATAWPDWRSAWALAPDYDIRRLEAPPAGLGAGKDELRLGRREAGFPASAWNSVFRTDGRGVDRVSPAGEAIPFVRQRGEEPAEIKGLALGEGGLLLLVEDADSGPAVLELRYRPAYEYPWRIGREPRVRNAAEARGHAVMAGAGCFSCHSLYGRRQVGPSLDRESLVPRLEERLGSAGYRARVAELDASEDEALQRWREARTEVLAAEGLARLETWLRFHLVEPRFDEPDARMPSMGLDEEQVAAVSRFLLAEAHAGD